jgi:hypothetical protein
MGILMGVLDDGEVRMMKVGVRLGARGGQGGRARANVRPADQAGREDLF